MALDAVYLGALLLGTKVVEARERWLAGAGVNAGGINVFHSLGAAARGALDGRPNRGGRSSASMNNAFPNNAQIPGRNAYGDPNRLHQSFGTASPLHQAHGNLQAPKNQQRLNAERHAQNLNALRQHYESKGAHAAHGSNLTNLEHGALGHTNNLAGNHPNRHNLTPSLHPQNHPNRVHPNLAGNHPNRHNLTPSLTPQNHPNRVHPNLTGNHPNRHNLTPSLTPSLTGNRHLTNANRQALHNRKAAYNALPNTARARIEERARELATGHVLEHSGAKNASNLINKHAKELEEYRKQKYQPAMQKIKELQKLQQSGRISGKQRDQLVQLEKNVKGHESFIAQKEQAMENLRPHAQAYRNALASTNATRLQLQKQKEKVQELNKEHAKALKEADAAREAHEEAKKHIGTAMSALSTKAREGLHEEATAEFLKNHAGLNEEAKKKLLESENAKKAIQAAVRKKALEKMPQIKSFAQTHKEVTANFLKNHMAKKGVNKLSEEEKKKLLSGENVKKQLHEKATAAHEAHKKALTNNEVRAAHEAHNAAAKAKHAAEEAQKRIADLARKRDALAEKTRRQEQHEELAAHRARELIEKEQHNALAKHEAEQKHERELAAKHTHNALEAEQKRERAAEIKHEQIVKQEIKQERAANAKRHAHTGR